VVDEGLEQAIVFWITLKVRILEEDL